jgi:hypothetical protein
MLFYLDLSKILYALFVVVLAFWFSVIQYCTFKGWLIKWVAIIGIFLFIFGFLGGKLLPELS